MKVLLNGIHEIFPQGIKGFVSIIIIIKRFYSIHSLDVNIKLNSTCISISTQDDNFGEGGDIVSVCVLLHRGE